MVTTDGRPALTSPVPGTALNSLTFSVWILSLLLILHSLPRKKVPSKSSQWWQLDNIESWVLHFWSELSWWSLLIGSSISLGLCLYSGDFCWSDTASVFMLHLVSTMGQKNEAVLWGALQSYVFFWTNPSPSPSLLSFPLPVCNLCPTGWEWVKVIRTLAVSPKYIKDSYNSTAEKQIIWAFE